MLSALAFFADEKTRRALPSNLLSNKYNIKLILRHGSCFIAIENRLAAASFSEYLSFRIYNLQILFVYSAKDAFMLTAERNR